MTRGPDDTPWETDGSVMVVIFYENFEERPDIMSCCFPEGQQSMKNALWKLSDASHCLDWVRNNKLTGSCTLSWFGLDTTHDTYEVSFHLTFEKKSDFRKFSKEYAVVEQFASDDNSQILYYRLRGVDEAGVTNYC